MLKPQTHKLPLSIKIHGEESTKEQARIRLHRTLDVVNQRRQEQARRARFDEKIDNIQIEPPHPRQGRYIGSDGCKCESNGQPVSRLKQGCD